MASQHPVKTKDDEDGWISRLNGFVKQLKDETARSIADAKKGIMPPKFIIETSLKQLRASYDDKNPVLVEVLAKKSKEAGLDADAYKAKAQEVYDKKILPAYKNLIDTFEGFLKTANMDAGVWKLPKGDEYYKACLAYWTTTNKTPDEVHEMGKALVISLGKEIDAGLKQLGLSLIHI